MPVISARQLRENPGLSEFSSFGIIQVMRGKTIEPHFHDCEEWWFITRGRALARTEGQEHEVGPGDMLYTPIGQEHEIIEVYQDLEGVYLEGPLTGEKRRGHLHRPEAG